MRVCEIYKSILGEGSCAGYSGVIIRLTGCNLRCLWCDTKYAYSEGYEIEPREILARTLALKAPYALLTGGEPLLQEETVELADSLHRAGMRVIIETNGSIDISPLPPSVVRVVDFKPPGSGMAHRNLWENVNHLRACDEVKFVIASYEDFLWACEKSREYNLEKRVSAILLSPAWGLLEPARLAEWIIKEDKLRMKLNLQLHKILWGERRGV